MKLLLIFLTLFPFYVFAWSMQLGAGGITPHFSSEKKNYCNQWNNTSLIVNKSYYIRVVGEKFGMTYMNGEDSICSPIAGTFFHYIFQRYEYIEVGLTVGGYEYNRKNWIRHAEETPADIDAPSTLLVEIGGKEYVPVLALDLGVHLIKRERWSLKLNNLFTPIIFNHSLAFEYRF